MNSRFARYAAVATASGLLLTACSETAPTAGEDAVDAVDAGDDAGAAGGTISVLSYWDGPPGSEILNDWLEACSALGPYEFEPVIVPQDELIPTAGRLTATGDAPGIIVADNQHVPTLAEAGALEPLDLDALGLAAEDFQEGPFSAGTYEGDQYALPVGSNGEVIFYNTRMLEEAGVEPPTSWQELSDAAAALTTDDVHGWAVTLAPGETSTWNWLTALWSNGGELTDLTSPEAVEAMEWYTSFVREGTSPEASLNWDDEFVGQFLDEKIAMIQTGTWWLPTIIEEAEKRGLEFGQTMQVSPDGSAPTVPFGGEVLTLGLGLDEDARSVANECIGLWFEPERHVDFAARQGYVPNYLPVQEEFLENNPSLETLATMLDNSRSRTAEVGSQYNALSPAIAAALQEVAGGQLSAEEALAQAQQVAG